MAKLEELGLDKSTLVFYTTDNGAWQDVYPDAGYTPFRGTKGTVREGGNRVPAIAVWPGKIPAGVRNSDIVGGLDLWQDPQERYDVFMTNWTEHTWTLVTFNQAVADLMKT
jgi:arylsulfatase A-like enzyme